ncbi:hypothetical protein QBC37DRAFT_299706 [Rhypophila decipiens]|uniref:Uncharacterized protein n=1 Tax=Rhypophila decipiens TaxID=261697 RepID=A0AAN7B119_9PEZI|nr:hypothetical protein QBC37DRAFT_299706 [Rhypophila decipiens]
MSPVVEPPTNDPINPLRIVPPTHPPTEEIPGPLPELEDDLTPDDYIPSYDCDGSVMCDAMSVAWCDDAVNFYLTRTDSAYYGTTANETRRGACTGWGSIGCAVFIQGNDDPKCRRTGNQMWWDYQDIRKQGQCWSCGTKHWYPGCMTTIGYVSWCKSDLLEHYLD